MVSHSRTQPTLWGLLPVQLHDRFWASRGVQVVRQGESAVLVDGADLYLLTDARSLVLFGLERVLADLSWSRPDLIFTRLSDRRHNRYRERAVANDDGRFIGFRRDYGDAEWRLVRVVLTQDPKLARFWQGCSDSRTAWKELRGRVAKSHWLVRSLPGSAYDSSTDDETMQFLRRLLQLWQRPDSSIRGVSNLGPGIWTDPQSRIGDATRFLGPVWIGAGRHLPDDASVMGPSILWDRSDLRANTQHFHWSEIEPTDPPKHAVRSRRRLTLKPISKRLFDVVFSLVALSVTLPFYPLIMLAIWLEDGRPFFFCHTREGRGGREFPCIKFRSMRKDAERIQAELRERNVADGPQFFVPNDPRLTHVGQFLRAFNIDELPQFLNVLAGHMAVVGPRPSPRAENQFSPAWREARLSVRPGITGLWQVQRTRQPGSDFQEWIKYDIEYVQKASWRLDLWIIYQTIWVIL